MMAENQEIRDAGMQAFRRRLQQCARHLKLSLSDGQLARMADHAWELRLWNRKINLTAITDPLEMAEKHFADSLAVHPFLKGATCLIDLGAGGGFPGVPLKVMNPDLKVLMVDASRKKVNFLKQVIRVLKLEKIDALHARVEDLHRDPAHAGQWEAVISRGFADLSKFSGLGAPFLKPGGTLYAMKGRQAKEEITPDLDKQFHIQCDYYPLPFEKADRYLIRLHPREINSRKTKSRQIDLP